MQCCLLAKLRVESESTAIVVPDGPPKIVDYYELLLASMIIIIFYHLIYDAFIRLTPSILKWNLEFIG